MEHNKGRKDTGKVIKLYIHFFTNSLPQNEKIAHPKGKISVYADPKRNIKTKNTYVIFNRLSEIQNKVEEVLRRADITIK